MNNNFIILRKLKSTNELFQNLRMCGGDVQQFCALTSTAFSWYVIGWVGCVLIILGVLLFFGIHASNYAHIGNANRFLFSYWKAVKTKF